MSHSVGILHRLDRAVTFGVLGAFLLTVISMGEARAAVITPSPSDGDPTDDLVRQTGAEPGPIDPEPINTCEGVFGVGKLVAYFGDDAGAIDLRGSDLSLDMGSALDGYDGDSLAVPFFPVEGDGFPDEGDGSDGLVAVALLLSDADACSAFLPAEDPLLEASGFQPVFSFPVTLTVTRDADTLECSADVGIAAWAAILSHVDDVAPTGDGEGIGVLSETPPSFFLWEALDDGGRRITQYTGADAVADGGAAFEAAVSADFAARIASPFDCFATPTVVAPVSLLALACGPAVVSPGAVVTCTVTGGDSGTEILWRASASPAFAGQGVRLDADGRGSFSFRVPATVSSGSVLVELVEWDRTATVVLTGSLVPTRVPAGEGMPSGRVALLGLVLLGAAGLRVRRTVLEG